MRIEMEDVSEYEEGYKVYLVESQGLYVYSNSPRIGAGRLAIRAYNEAGHNSTEVDLLELIAWIRRHRPELLTEQKSSG